MIPGGIFFLAGEPGIGKSTLLLQVATMFPGKVLYVSGEESNEQINLRADRMKTSAKDLWLVSEVELEKIKHHISQVKPDLVILDSIQTTHSGHLGGEPGNIAQLRHRTREMQRLANRTNIPALII